MLIQVGLRGTYHYTDIFPHYVIAGDWFIKPTDAVISKTTFYLEDAKRIFDDFGAFGGVFFDAEPLVKEIIEKASYLQDRPTGPNARILYYTGHDQIMSTDTALGRVVAEHKSGFVSSDNGGIMEGKVAVSIEFETPIRFNEAIDRTALVIEYLGLVIGRTQNLEALYIGTEESLKSQKVLSVEWTMHEKRSSSRAKISSHDVLIDGARQTQEFADTLKHWLERQQTWHAARWRFFSAFSNGSSYDIDRLIASANMFDILPSSAVPYDNSLSPELSDARKRCRSIFEDLDQSPERDSILGALGRLGKSSLKRKIRHRAAILTNLSDRFSELHRVTDEAVNCRNYYVHGSEGTFDYNANFDQVLFFTNTLEFVFAASDLIEAGWDFTRWLSEPTSASHPFGAFKVEYQRRINKLLSLLPNKTSIASGSAGG